MKGQGQGVVKIELSRTDSTYPNPKPRGNLAYISLVAIKSEGEKEKACFSGNRHNATQHQIRAHLVICIVIV